MPYDKDVLKKRFSEQPDKYYRVALFDELGYVRKRCANCRGFFWTLDEKRVTCPEQPCQEYEFLGSPATKLRVDYVNAWKIIADFFKKNGHQEVARYPVVCRWRQDLFFTIASIVDFQRYEMGKVVFEFPSNPLIVPQMCLRFSDIANVGVTGRHYTSFCMIGQHALANSRGYWKDRCIELDFKLLTEEFGIDRTDVVFKEDVWLGPGAFGNSLEYYVKGLELGNAVFTSFEGTPENYKEYPEKVIDMGAGLERFVWASQGTFNSYEAVFDNVLKQIRKETGLSLESDKSLDGYFKLSGSLDSDEFKGMVNNYSGIARKLGIDQEELRTKLRPVQAIYSILDHTRTLLFAISDGMLPSNVGGGYNLRVILRRAIDFLDDINVKLSLIDLIRWHAESLNSMYPELIENVKNVETVIEVELRKYLNTKVRASRIVETLSKKKETIGVEELVRLYDSDGITPDLLKKSGLEIETPEDFYNRITSKHMSEKVERETITYDLSSLPPTMQLYYRDNMKFKFEATVQGILPGDYVVLDTTAFYPRGGGQEPDHGTIGNLEVDDVIKVNDVILHHVKNPSHLSRGDKVEGNVDSRRRSLITKHHTATHVVNGASRKILGAWVWQHSAFKDIDLGRLDITHFSHLSRDQVIEIERLANDIIRRNLPVSINTLPRMEAERKYGFRLYQGGAAPVKELRVVNIEGFDVEACGGTHVSRTGEIGLIKIIKTERVQDGIERLEFVAGEAAVEYVEKQESLLLDSATMLETPTDKLSATISNLKSEAEETRRNAKSLAKRLAELMVSEIPKLNKDLGNGLKIYTSLYEYGLDSEYHLIVGDRICKLNPSMVYLAMFEENSHTKLIMFSGEIAQKNGAKSGSLIRELARKLGGSGGGDSRFGQGGIGTRPESLPDLISLLKSLLASSSS